MPGSGWRWRVVSSSPSFGKYSDEPVCLLEKAGCDVELLPHGDRGALADALLVADAWIAGFEPVSAATLNGIVRLRVAAKCGAGLDNFDLDYLNQRGIAVVSVPRGNAAAVAEYAMSQILGLARGLVANDAAVRSGAWGPRVGLGLCGRTLGVVGFGAIGREVARLATAFGMTVIAADPLLTEPPLVAGRTVDVVTLSDLLTRADVISVHVPLTDETHGLIGAAELRSMQPHAYLVNDSRGGVVDEAALATALTEAWIAGAALDVFATEPLPTDHPLLSAPGLVVSPHTAGYSDSAMHEVTTTCARSVLAALRSAPARV